MYTSGRHDELQRRSGGTAPRKVRLPAAAMRQAASLFQPRSPSTVCRPCTSLWWNEVLKRGLCLASLQGLQHLPPVRHASGKVDASDLLLSDCERFPKTSFCVTAEFPRLYRTCQNLPEHCLAGPARPDITLLKPQLQKQWHHVKNQHLGNIQVSTNSGLRVWLDM